MFLFPFYYMVVGSFQKSPDTTVKGVFPTGGWTLHNYADINSRVDLVQSLLNSVIVTSGVLFGTVLFGVLAGYALARLQLPGPRHALRGDAARADHPVPAADHPDLRADRPQLRTGRQLRSA